MPKLRIESLIRCFSAMWGGGKPRPRFAAVLAATLCLLLSAVPAFAHPKTSPELRHSNSGKGVDVIVQFTVTPTDRHIAKVTGKGAALKRKLSLINAAAFKHLPASAVARLAQDPEVAYISPDRQVMGSALDYAPESVNAPWAWQALQQLGQAPNGVGVAVIDSGISPVGDLYWYNTLTGAYGLRIVYSQNFVEGATDASDAYGHGTHVAGIIAGAGWSSWGNRYSHTFRGIAPNTNLINLRALDQNGMGTDSSVIAAIQAAINLKSQYNIRVINLSLGRQVYESYTLDPLCQAVEAAWRAGIVVVLSAGNQGRNDDFSTEGYGTIAAPGNDPYVITVGAMKTDGTPDRGDDTVASYSSKGPTAFDHVVKPDIVAPGNRVVSLRVSNSQLPKQYSSVDVYMPEYVSRDTKDNTSPAYMRLSGTSMAVPAVSGTAALMIQADPTLTPDTVKARLMKSATKTFPAVSTTVIDPTTGQTFTSYYDMFTIGAGYLDVQGALLSTDIVPAELTAKSPTAAYDPATGNVYLVSDTSVLWGSSVIWGTSVVWGSAVFSGATVDGQSVLWGDSVIWGASTEEGFAVIWGSSVIWGSTTQAESMSVLTKGEK